jgi:hypothetical protein
MPVTEDDTGCLLVVTLRRSGSIVYQGAVLGGGLLGRASVARMSLDALFAVVECCASWPRLTARYFRCSCYFCQYPFGVSRDVMAQWRGAGEDLA